MADKRQDAAPEEAPDESVSGGAVTDSGFEKQAESQPREDAEQPAQEPTNPEFDPDNPGGVSFDYGPAEDRKEASAPDEGDNG